MRGAHGVARDVRDGFARLIGASHRRGNAFQADSEICFKDVLLDHAMGIEK